MKVFLLLSSFFVNILGFLVFRFTIGHFCIHSFIEELGFIRLFSLYYHFLLYIVNTLLDTSLMFSWDRS